MFKLLFVLFWVSGLKKNIVVNRFQSGQRNWYRCHYLIVLSRFFVVNFIKTDLQYFVHDIFKLERTQIEMSSRIWI